jgi:hypothetical protein
MDNHLAQQSRDTPTKAISEKDRQSPLRNRKGCEKRPLQPVGMSTMPWMRTEQLRMPIA